MNRTWLRTLVALVLFVSAVGSAAAGGGPIAPAFTLTVLHNNDGESRLINAGTELADYGGVARFATVADRLRAEGEGGPGRGAVMISSGDNFLAGPQFSASQRKGPPFYDSIAMSQIGYDVAVIGNHEFDFGPDVLASFIGGFAPPVPFISANLNLAGEPALQALADRGIIVKSVVLNEQGVRIGVVGATTPRLASISSPRRVVVDPNVAGVVQGQIDQLQGQGVNIIIVASHLQDVGEDLSLAPMLRGVDIMIAGGGDELLANADDLLVPGDVLDPNLPYPLYATAADNAQIPVITTAGDYKYVGRLIARFDQGGALLSVDPASGPVRVAGGANPDAVAPDPAIQQQVVDPVAQHVAGLAANVIGTSEVALEGRRDPGIRTQETNLGNLAADALLWQGRQLAAGFGAPAPDVALQNGGGIRNNTLIPAGPITELTTFDIFPFSNFTSIVPNVPAQQFKEIMENAVSRVETADGRFAQIAGFRMVYTLAGTAQVVDDAGTVLTPGSRVREITLDDGTAIVRDGAVVAGAPAIDVATIDFSARGGDQYPFRGLPTINLGVSYQQALANYIVNGLGGVIRAADYPEGGEGRSTRQ